MNIKQFTLGFALMAMPSFFTAYGQVTVHTIKDGKKTPLPEGEAVALTLNDDGVPQGNIVIVVDFKAFTSKHKYDDILVEFGRPGMLLRETPRISLEFEAEHVKRKYANVTHFNFYAFMNADYVEALENSSPTHSKYYVRAEDMPNTYFFRVSGRFKTGRETYYDESSKSYKTRDVYGGNEIIRSVEVTFVQNQNILVSRRYADLVTNEYKGEMNGFPTSYYMGTRLFRCAAELEKITVGIGPLTKPKYKNLIEALKEVAEAKHNEIKAEPDKAKAMEMYDAWHKEYYSFCFSETKANAAQLKELDRELGAASGTSEKLEIMRKYVR
jgi:hypothetical protein